MLKPTLARAIAVGALSVVVAAPAALGDGTRCDCSAMPERALTRTLAADRPAGPGTTLQLRVRATVGAGESLVVATADGRILGSVTPFGPVGDRSVITARMSPPAGAGTEPVELRFWMVARDGTCRTPSSETLVDVALVPVSSRR